MSFVREVGILTTIFQTVEDPLRDRACVCLGRAPLSWRVLDLHYSCHCKTKGVWFKVSAEGLGHAHYAYKVNYGLVGVYRAPVEYCCLFVQHACYIVMIRGVMLSGH